MSRRYSHNNRQPQESINNDNNYNGNSSKTRKKFFSKSQNQSPRPNPNPNPTFSNSLRESLSIHSDAAVSSSSRVRMGDKGEWVSCKAAGGAEGGGNFLNYLPQDEAVAAGLGADEGGLDPVESQRVVDILNRELSRLLKLSPREFWREVARDTSLHEFLDSFLKFRSRWYDFPHRGAKGIVAGVIVGEFELSRRVFMVLYRISSNRDPRACAADTLSSKDHAALLQEKKLLDLPQLLDICAMYGHENEELTRLLISNALKAQPGVHDNLTAMMSHFLGIMHTMHQRCMTSLEVLFSSGGSGTRPLHTDFLEVMDFINDAVVSLDAFVTAFKPAAMYFSCPVEISPGNEDLLITLAGLYDTLLPSLQQGFRIILVGEDDAMIVNVAVSLKMLSMRVVKLAWKLLDFCYLSREMLDNSLLVPTVIKIFPAKVEDPVIRADILIQTFREINGVLLNSPENQNRDTFLQTLNKNYHLMSKLQSLQDAGWIFMDDEQLQYLSGLMVSSLKSTVKEPPSVLTPVLSDKVQVDEDTAIMESKISQIKDLFPDYGNGFLAACLEVYNHNPEEVIQRILEGTLHEDLTCLDTKLEAMSISKSASTLISKDKGKGKLVESAPFPPTTALRSANPVAATGQETEGASASSLSTVGRFVRKSTGEPDHYTLDVRDKKDTARTAALMSQYEYEDEYDDSFDDLGLSVAESVLEENEMSSDRISSNLGRSSRSETESPAQSGSDTKWGSRKKPQFYVKDGKNYSYKVAGSVAVANVGEASLVNLAQAELIHGLGRGGNIPLGAVKKLTEYQEQDSRSDEPEMEGRVNSRNPRGRGSRGGGMSRESQEEQDKKSDESVVEGRGNAGNNRGRGRRGRGGNHYRKDRAMSKHFSGVSGF